MNFRDHLTPFKVLLHEDDNTRVHSRYFSVLGGILVAVGCFVPLVHVPFLGDLNYFSNSRVDGFVGILLASLGTVCGLCGVRFAAATCGIGMLIFLGLTFCKDSDSAAALALKFGGQCGVGIPLLVIGALVMIAAAFVKDGSRSDSVDSSSTM